MRKLLANQKALVTGASSGIGYGIAQAMADAGAAVAINYHSEREAAEELAEMIRAAGGEAVALKADVSKEEEVEHLFSQSVTAFGRLDILVANAGIQKDAPLAEMSPADWRMVLDVNLTGQFLCAKRAVAEFLRREPLPDVSRATGKIICISSVHDVIPWAGHINYAASKGGIQMMMKTLAQEVAHHRIRVNAIAPGAIKTAINEADWSTSAAAQKLLELIPYGRVGEVEDVAKAAVWLASDEADYVTGTTLYIDGGMMLYPAFRDNG